jgi:hypothetical protein
MFILFVIIAVVTFHARDFDLRRALTITAVYMALMVVYFSALLMTFKIKIDATK